MGQLEALLNGINHLEPVDLSQWGGPAEVLVRPLSGWEAAGVERALLGGIKAEVIGNMANAQPSIENLGEFLESQKLANVQAVQYGLSHSGDVCTPEQAAQLPATWVDALYQVVHRISGLESREDSFRGVPGAPADGGDVGYGDASSEPERGTSSSEPAGVDAPPT